MECSFDTVVTALAVLEMKKISHDHGLPGVSAYIGNRGGDLEEWQYEYIWGIVCGTFGSTVHDYDDNDMYFTTMSDTVINDYYNLAAKAAALKGMPFRSLIRGAEDMLNEELSGDANLDFLTTLTEENDGYELLITLIMYPEFYPGVFLAQRLLRIKKWFCDEAKSLRNLIKEAEGSAAT